MADHGHKLVLELVGAPEIIHGRLEVGRAGGDPALQVFVEGAQLLLEPFAGRDVDGEFGGAGGDLRRQFLLLAQEEPLLRLRSSCSCRRCASSQAAAHRMAMGSR